MNVECIQRDPVPNSGALTLGCLKEMLENSLVLWLLTDEGVKSVDAVVFNWSPMQSSKLSSISTSPEAIRSVSSVCGELLVTSWKEKI